MRWSIRRHSMESPNHEDQVAPADRNPSVLSRRPAWAGSGICRRPARGSGPALHLLSSDSCSPRIQGGRKSARWQASPPSRRPCAARSRSSSAMVGGRQPRNRWSTSSRPGASSRHCPPFVPTSAVLSPGMQAGTNSSVHAMAASSLPTAPMLSGPPPRSLDSLKTKVSGGKLLVKHQYFRPDVPNKQVVS